MVDLGDQEPAGGMSAEEFFLKALQEFEGMGYSERKEASERREKKPSGVQYVDPLGFMTQDDVEIQKRDVIRKLAEFGCKCIDVKGDGDCQFASLSLLLYGTVEKKDQLRAQAVDELRTHEAMYKAYVHGVTFNEYCESMSKPFTWGDHLTLQALANALNIRIIVIAAREQNKGITSFEVTSPTAKNSYYLGFIQELHYMAAVEWPDVEKLVVEPLNITASRPIETAVETLEDRCLQFGMRLSRNAEDENSLFAAFATLMGGYPNDYREIAYQELLVNQIVYEHKHEQAFAEYLYRLRSHNAAGDQRVLRALCNHQKVQVTLLNLEGTKIVTSIFGPPGASDMFYLGCYRGRVYQAIVPK